VTGDPETRSRPEWMDWELSGNWELPWFQINTHPHLCLQKPAPRRCVQPSGWS